MNLKLINITPGATLWHQFSLDPATDGDIEPCDFEILETDQVQFRLTTNKTYISAKLIIESMEIDGDLSPDGDKKTVFEWVPRSNARYGRDALFLHYFGVAQPAVELIGEDGEVEVVAFKPFNILGRKITAERAEAMLSYISQNANEQIMEAISPTSYAANLTSKGVAPADALWRMESSLKVIDGMIRYIIRSPITGLRRHIRSISSPDSTQIDDYGINWIAEHAGIAEDANSQDDALFKYALKWKSMPHADVSVMEESTDLYENQLIRLLLARVLAECRKILDECLEARRRTLRPVSRLHRTGYVSFFDVAKKDSVRASLSYEIRARKCIGIAERCNQQFNTHVPTSNKTITRIEITSRIKENRHYILLLEQIEQWMNSKDINWIARTMMGSVHSTPVLFEYYTLLLVDAWLKKHGEPDTEGLFKGRLEGKEVTLLYEPRYPSPIATERAEYGIWASDRENRRGRRPDIVIDVQASSQERRKLYILDAKCRGERDVLRHSMPECALKYGYGLRDADGHCPVRAVVTLHPRPESKTEMFLDFHHAPYDLFGAKRAYPVIGSQRISINPGGSEFGLGRLLQALLLEAN